jgi:hypothetical protein
LTPLAWSFFILGGAVLAVVLLEFGARLGLRLFGGYYAWWPNRRQRFEIDQESLPVLPSPAHWQANSAGERGGSPPAPGESCYRVLLAGGSCVEGYYLDQPLTAGCRIEAHLSEPGHLAALDRERVHVGSVARSRISCAQIRLMLERSLPRYESLDCIVLMVGASDLVRWLERGAPSEAWTDSAPLSHIFELHPQGPYSWNPRRSALRSLLVRLHHRWFPTEHIRQRVGKQLIHQRERRQNAREFIDETPDPREMIAVFGRELRALIELGKAKAKTVVVVRQPWFDKELTPEENRWMWNFARGEIYGTEVDVYYTHRVVRELMEKIAIRCGEVTRACGAVDLDVSGLLEPGLENFYDYLHTTPGGTDLMAKEMARSIVDNLHERKLAG